MNYKTHGDFLDIINQQCIKLRNNVFFMLFIFLIYSYFMYFSNEKVINAFYVFCEVLFISILGFINYNQISSFEKSVNNTAVEIAFLRDEIVIKTVGYKFFWINKQSKELIFKTNNTNFRQISYPLKNIYDLDNGTLKLIDSDKMAYIITDFFDKDIINTIKEAQNC